MSELFTRSNCSVTECFPEKPSWCRNVQVCQGVRVTSFEGSNGLDTELYKSIPFLHHWKLVHAFVKVDECVHSSVCARVCVLLHDMGHSSRLVD